MDWGFIKGRLEATSKRWKLTGMEKSLCSPVLLLTSVMRDPAEPKDLCHGDKHTHLAQESERLKEVLREGRTVVGPSAASCAHVLSLFSHV